MSRGSPRITFRITEELLAEVEVEIASQAEHSPNGPEDVSAFITRAICERIDHRRRARAHRRAKKAPVDDDYPLEVVSLADRQEGGAE